MGGSTAPEQDLMTPEQLAAEWQMSPKSLANMRSRREGPPYIKLGGRLVRYSRSAVEDWLAAQQDDRERARVTS